MAVIKIKQYLENEGNKDIFMFSTILFLPWVSIVIITFIYSSNVYGSSSHKRVNLGGVQTLDARPHIASPKGEDIKSITAKQFQWGRRK